MTKPAKATEFRRAGVTPPVETRPPFWRPLALMALCIAALSLSFAPISQCYLAWVGLVPFILLVHERRSMRSTFFYGWLTGILFFSVNMWWLMWVTIPGTFALVIYLGIFWALAAILFRGCGLLDRNRSAIASVLLLATAWTALEWLRGSYSPFGHHGLPWLYVGYTQTPLLAGCQIADITGVYGVTFWVVLINAIAARCWIERENINRLVRAIAVVSAIVGVVFVYGIFRMVEHKPGPGPTVLVVQPDYPQSNNGEKGAELDDIVFFHVRTTREALEKCAKDGVKVDLVVWSETMMPALNKASIAFLRGWGITMGPKDAERHYDYGQFIEETSQQIAGLGDRYRTGLLVGGVYEDNWKSLRDPDGHEYPMPGDHRNSTFFYEPTGQVSSSRYDKIQLLPFGEYVPYKQEIPPLYRLLVSLGPKDMEYYELTPGAPDALTVFKLETYPREAPTSQPVQSVGSYRFVTPICFEDIVSPLVRDLLNGGDGTKRADFLVNVTNDGWFKANERTQHMQAAVFRSIENRVPTARSVNTGVSGFIDSVGRISDDKVAANTEGWAVHQLSVDSRVTFYTRMGDVFANLCAVVTAGMVGYSITMRRMQKSKGEGERGRRGDNVTR